MLCVRTGSAENSIWERCADLAINTILYILTRVCVRSQEDLLGEGGRTPGRRCDYNATCYNWREVCYVQFYLHAKLANSRTFELFCSERFINRINTSPLGRRCNLRNSLRNKSPAILTRHALKLLGVWARL